MTDIAAEEIARERTRRSLRPASDAINTAWQEKHRDIIESWNDWIEVHGLPLEHHRLF